MNQTSQHELGEFEASPADIEEYLEQRGPDYGELVLRQYEIFSQMLVDHEAGNISAEALAECKAELHRLKALDGEQVSQLLVSRRALKPGEGREILGSIDERLEEYRRLASGQS